MNFVEHRVADETSVTELDGAGWVVLFLCVGGAVLVGTLEILRRLLALVRFSRSRRELVDRSAPVVVGLVGVLYLLFALTYLFRDFPNYMPVVLTLVVGAVVAASWFAIKDLVSGVLLRAGGLCREGDHVRLESVEGVVREMGLRVMVVETKIGEEALVPYSAVARGSIVRASVGGEVAPHTFSLRVPEHVLMSEARSLIREAAWRSPWSSLGREPQVNLSEDHHFEVTIFSISGERVSTVEMDVRESVRRWATGRD